MPKTCLARSLTACLGAPTSTVSSLWLAPVGLVCGTRPWQVLSGSLRFIELSPGGLISPRDGSSSTRRGVLRCGLLEALRTSIPPHSPYWPTTSPVRVPGIERSSCIWKLRRSNRAADAAINVACDLAGTGSWATLARLGQTLARDCPVAGPIAEPRHVAKHADAPWHRRLIRFARQSSGWTGRAPAPGPVLIAEASGAQFPPALPASPVLPDAHWLEPPPRPAVRRTTVRNVTPDITAHLLGELRVAFQDRSVETLVIGEAAQCSNTS